MKRLEGGYLGGRPTWSLASNPGIWGIEQVYARRAAGTWPIGTGSFDEFYEYVTLSLHMDGSNNSTSFITSQLSPRTVTGSGNAKISTVDFKFGGASAYFDGSGDYLTLGNAPLRFLGEDFTIEFWCKIETNVGGSAASNYPYLMSTSIYNANGGFYITINGSNTGWGGSGVLSFASSTGSNGPGLASTSVIRNAGWKHIAVTRQGSSFRLFVDGILESSAIDSDASYTGNSGYLMVSTNTNGTVITDAGSNDKGYIDDLRITKGYARYTSDFSVPTGPYEDEGAPLADPFYNYVSLLLPMNGSNNSTTFTDKSPNALTVTANGDAKLSTAVKRYGTSSAVFDGDNDWLTATSSGLAFGTGDFTIECFVRWVGDTAFGNAGSNLIDFRTAEPSTQISVYITSSASSPAQSIRLYVNGADRIVSTTLATQNIWRHFALARSAGTTTMYIDGVSQGTWADSSNYSGTTAYIGGRFVAISGDQRSLNGYIDDLRITKGVARYTANFIPPLPHGDYGTLADPYLGATSLLMPMEGPVNSTGFFDRAKRLPATTYGNAKVSNAQYKWGLTSAAFDGAGDYVTIQDSDDLNFGSSDFTIEMWIYSTAANPNATYLYSKRTTTTFGSIVILFVNSALKLIASGDGSTWGVDFTSTSGITQNKWTHVAFTRSGSSWRMFFNGNQVGAQTASVNPTTTTAPVAIGTENSGSPSIFFAGYIDDLRIIKGQALYTANFTPPTAPINSEASSDPYLGNVSLLLKMDGDNNSTTFTDSSLTPNTVTANGDAKISTAQSKFGGSSALLDGTGDYLSLAHNAEFSIESSNFTLEAWIYVSASNVLQNILNKRVNTPTESGWGWRITAANALQFFHTGGSVLISTSTISSGAWTHIAVTRSGSTVRQFINGILDATTATFSNGVSNTQELRIGIDEGAADGFNGYIDDLRITKGVARYTSNFLPPTIGHPVWNVSSMDPDAATYITAVEAADAQALEDPVKIAIDQFVRGCKYDNIWTAIKACCILAGARTLNGALVPLVGTAPTNVNFVSGDYNRETGLVGDGSTKYLNSNRNNNVDPQNSKHVSVFITEAQTRDITRAAICSRQAGGTIGATHLVSNDTVVTFRVNTTGVSQVTDNSLFTGLYGASRSTSTSVARRLNGSSATFSETSSTPTAVPIDIFSRNGADFSNGRLAFYSIGESLDLEKLDTRVTALVAAIGAAIA